MTIWNKAALAGALVAAAGVGAALAPAAKAQSDVTSLVEMMLDKSDGQSLVWAGGGRLGVSVRDVTEDDAKRAGQGSSRTGVVIEQVNTESPAEKAGFKTGDIVIEFDGERVRSTRQFTRLVQETPPGRQVSAVVVRDGQKTTLTVQPRDTWTGFSELGDYFRYEFPARMAAPKPPAVPKLAPEPRLFVEPFALRSGTTLGVTVSDMSDQLAAYFGAEGALVTSVAEGSAAAKAGLKAGDVITAINGETVRVPGDVRRAAGRLPSSGEFTVDVLRDKKKLTLKGKTEPRTERRRVII